jgi:hypothetical protein
MDSNRGLAAWAFVALAVAASRGAHAAERYEGMAYARGTERLAYRETDWLFVREGVRHRLTLYRCADGTPFARKEVADDPSAIAPNFEFIDGRDGYREGVRTQGGSREIFVQHNARAPVEVRPLPAEPAGVIDAGFDAFIRAHWHELADGRSRRIPFLIPDRFGYLNFRIEGTSSDIYEGRPARELKMTLAAWYGFALSSIELVYDASGQRLEQYRGIGTVRDAAGRHQDVRIEFPASAHRDAVPEGEIDRAAAESLGNACIRNPPASVSP